MRKVILAVLVLVSVHAFGQNPTNYLLRSTRERLISSMVDSMLRIPRYCGVPSGVRVSEVSTIDGALAMDTCNNRLYMFSGNAWVKIANYLDLGTGSVDSIWRVVGKDSIFYSKNGNTYKIKDSTGAYRFGKSGEDDIALEDRSFTLNEHTFAWPDLEDFSDTVTWKPMVVSVDNGQMRKATYWPGSGSGGSGINNQFTSKQTADFWISGRGRFADKRETLGTIVNNNFTGGFGSFDSSFASVTRTWNGSYLQVTGGNGSFNNYIRYTNYTGLNNWTQQVKFVPTDLSGTTYGIGLGVNSSNSFFATGFTVQFICNSGTDKGKMRLWNNTGTQIGADGANSIAFNTTDTLIATVQYINGIIYASFYNKSQNVAATYTYDFGTATAGSNQAPNTGKLSMWFFGGTQKIFNYNIQSLETKKNVVFLGNSITYGYTATTSAQRFASLVFPAGISYQTSGGPGDRSNEGVLVIPELKSLAPKYVVYCLGVNDAQNSVSTSTYSTNVRKTLDSLIANSITPILVSNSPNNSYNLTAYNDTLSAIATRYGLKYVNTFDSLRNGTAWKTNYTTDNIHPNDSGHLVIARIITRSAPEILGDSSIYLNRPMYLPNARYLMAMDSTDGKVGVTMITAGSVSSTSVVTANGFNGTVATSTTTPAITIGTSLTDHQIPRPLSGALIGSTALTYDGTNFIIYPGSDGLSTFKVKNASGNHAFSAGTYSGFSNNGVVYLGNITPSTSNYALAGNSSELDINGATMNFRIAGGSSPNAMAINASSKVGINVNSPTSTFHINGSFAQTYIAKSADYTATVSDCVIEVTATGKTITLPTAVGITGRVYTIKLTASGSGTVATTSSQTIDGSTTYSLASQYKYVTVQSNGSNWIIIANN